MNKKELNKKKIIFFMFLLFDEQKISTNTTKTFIFELFSSYVFVYLEKNK